MGFVWTDVQVRNSLVIDIGVVGSWAYGQEAQGAIHKARGFESPKGWDDQLHNELGVMAVYERTWRFPRHERRIGFDWEVLPHVGLAVGNVQTYANVGGELRAGINLPDDFGTAPIGPAETTATPVQRGQQAERVKSFDLGSYVFARVDGRVVAHNVFLDGNTFGDSPSVDRKWLVADLSVGASLNYRNTKLTYALVYRTKEFDTQKGNGSLFGSVSLNFPF